MGDSQPCLSRCFEHIIASLTGPRTVSTARRRDRLHSPSPRVEEAVRACSEDVASTEPRSRSVERGETFHRQSEFSRVRRPRTNRSRPRESRARRGQPLFERGDVRDAKISPAALATTPLQDAESWAAYIRHDRKDLVTRSSVDAAHKCDGTMELRIRSARTTWLSDDTAISAGSCPSAEIGIKIRTRVSAILLRN